MTVTSLPSSRSVSAPLSKSSLANSASEAQPSALPAGQVSKGVPASAQAGSSAVNAHAWRPAGGGSAGAGAASMPASSSVVPAGEADSDTPSSHVWMPCRRQRAEHRLCTWLA